MYRPPALFQSDRPQPPNGEKRSSNIMANWFTAVSHPLTVLDVFSWPRIARQISFSAASSEGNEPRVLIDFRITLFRLSIAFVV